MRLLLCCVFILRFSRCIQIRAFEAPVCVGRAVTLLRLLGLDLFFGHHVNSSIRAGQITLLGPVSLFHTVMGGC
jgi:hypothetical protein